MDALKAEIERKRKLKEHEFGGRKYARLADLQASRDEQQHGAEEDTGARGEGEQATLANAPAEQAADTGTAHQGGHAPTSIAAAAAELLNTALPKEVEGVSNQEAVRRLRLLGHPATLFGESDTDRLLRLHVIQQNISLQAQVDVGAGQQANEWQRTMRDLATGKAAVPAKDKGRTAGGPPPPGSELQNGDGAAAGEEDPLGAAFRQAAADLAAQRAENAQEPPDRIIVHLKRLVEEWEAETQARAEAQPAWAASMEGRNAISTMRLSKEHIKPLFRQLKRRECPSDIERALWCIVKAMRVRNYKEAGDLYVRVAIGNAPWPIGVTMVGIHERSGRERISATSTAHIMHDEQTRKYLQAVKRLITYAQRRYPSTPSLSLEYNAPAGGMSALPAPAQGGGDAAGGKSEPLLLLEAAMPSSYVNAADGSRQDGWRANDQDVRTWKSIMRAAYKDETEKPAAV